MDTFFVLNVYEILWTFQDWRINLNYSVLIEGVRKGDDGTEEVGISAKEK